MENSTIPPERDRDTMDWVQTGSLVYGAAQLGRIAGYLEHQEYKATVQDQQRKFEEASKQADRYYRSAVRDKFEDDLYGLVRLRATCRQLMSDRYVSMEQRYGCHEYAQLRMAEIERRLPDFILKDVPWFVSWLETYVLPSVNSACPSVHESEHESAPIAFTSYVKAVVLAIGAAIAFGTAVFTMEGESALTIALIGTLLLVVSLASLPRMPLRPGVIVFQQPWEWQFKFLGEMGMLSELEVNTLTVRDVEAFRARMAAKQAEIDATPISRMYQCQKESYERADRPWNPAQYGVAEAREEFARSYARLEPVPPGEEICVP